MPAGGLAELLLGRAPLLEQAVELLVAAAALGLGRGTPFRDLRKPTVEPLEVGGREADAELLDLLAELRRTLGRRRLERERPQALADLRLEIARALDLRSDAGELQLGAVAAALEPSKPGRVLHEGAPLRRLGRKDLLDAALGDDGVHLAAEPEVGEELHQVGAADVRAVHEVLAVAVARQAPADRDLGVRQRLLGVRVVEEQLDRGELGRPAVGAAGVQDVLGLFGAQLVRAQAAGRPDDRVGDVRLARAVRPDDDGDARLEAHLDRVRERLEAAQADRTQIHAPGSMPCAAVGAVST